MEPSKATENLVRFKVNLLNTAFYCCKPSTPYRSYINGYPEKQAGRCRLP